MGQKRGRREGAARVNLLSNVPIESVVCGVECWPVCVRNRKESERIRKKEIKQRLPGGSKLANKKKMKRRWERRNEDHLVKEEEEGAGREKIISPVFNGNGFADFVERGKAISQAKKQIRKMGQHESVFN